MANVPDPVWRPEEHLLDCEDDLERLYDRVDHYAAILRGLHQKIQAYIEAYCHDLDGPPPNADFIEELREMAWRGLREKPGVAFNERDLAEPEKVVHWRLQNLDFGDRQVPATPDEAIEALVFAFPFSEADLYRIDAAIAYLAEMSDNVSWKLRNE